MWTPCSGSPLVDVMGVRRSGKTYLMFHTAQKFMSGVEVLYVNPEDRRLLLINWDPMEGLEGGRRHREVRGEGGLSLQVDVETEVSSREWAKLLIDARTKSKSSVSPNPLKALPTRASSPVSG